MKLKHLSLPLIVGLTLTSASALAYDANLAKSYQQQFANVEGAVAGKNLGLMSPAAFVEATKAGKEMVALDIRTPAEMSIFGLALPDSLNIPANQVFEAENLAKLPTDKPIVVFCKSGARATALGTALRHAGFDNVKILKGGFKGLSAYMGPKEAN
ncbi:rhodanese-like domain-containing protein [Shewanella submarina]|uniref:Rhodanese-like domain-containing protein n=1 Tax=Shewanella submarina TaxID=2016376 RepID=A0ABV7GHZ3_9GAMM|nr:rhodanese-like domain-containing protein [Shewanella submarina]MCL1037822.1 rhodanese-like domain-containing protein [Shewanella submarina]